MYEVPKFKTTKDKQQIYSCYLISKLDIFKIYMPKHTCMNYELALKKYQIDHMFLKSLTHKQKQLNILLKNKSKNRSKYLKYIIKMLLG